MVFQREEILRRSRTVHISHAAHRSSGKVHCHGHAIFFGHVANFVGLKNSARRCEVRMNLADSVFLAEHTEWFLEKDIFAGQDWRGALIRNFF